MQIRVSYPPATIYASIKSRFFLYINYPRKILVENNIRLSFFVSPIERIQDRSKEKKSPSKFVLEFLSVLKVKFKIKNCDSREYSVS